MMSALNSKIVVLFLIFSIPVSFAEAKWDTVVSGSLYSAYDDNVTYAEEDRKK
jgi:hypothetical protein